MTHTHVWYRGDVFVADAHTASRVRQHTTSSDSASFPMTTLSGTPVVVTMEAGASATVADVMPDSVSHMDPDYG